MITVPYEVKQALRDGMLRKNYRFVVAFEDWIDAGRFKAHPEGQAMKPEESYVIEDTYKYRFVINDPDSDDYTFQYAERGAPYSVLPAIERNVWELTGTGELYIRIIGPSGYSLPVIVKKYIDGFTIDNDNLVSESVSIDERMCSGDTLKFGLCEGSSLEFQYFEKPNITGKNAQAFVDVNFKENPYNDICIINGYSDPDSEYPQIYHVTEAGDYRVFIKAIYVANVMHISYFHNGFSHPINLTILPNGDGEVIFNNCVVGDSFTIINNYHTHVEGVVQSIEDITCTIPMGFFDVAKCSRQASTGIIKVTAYNKLQSDYLDAKANDLIEQTVEVGESGVAGSATVDTILMRLLDEYAIKPKFIKASYTVPSTWTIASGYNSSYVVENGGYMLIPYGSVSIDISHLDPDGCYRLFIDRDKIRDELWTAMGAYTSLRVRAPGHSSEGYRPLNELVYADGPSSDMHLVSPAYVTFLMISGRVYGNVYVAGGDDQIYSDSVIKKYTTNALKIEFPMTFIYDTSGTAHTAQSAWNDLPADTRVNIQKKWTDLFADPTVFRIEKRDSNGLGSIEFTNETVKTLPDVTLRELQSSVYEISCQFGRLSRVTDLFEGVELNHSRLYPADTLYLSDSLYPSGAALSGFKSMYSKLWADEGNVHKWRYLIITYKGLDEEQNEKDFTLQRTVNADGTDDYNMSDNWLFRNLVWTAADVGDYADAMVAKMQDVTWFPFEMWCAGLPYIETGDEIEIPLNGESYTSYVLQRQLKGIQNLQDTYINGTLDIF